MPMHAGVEEAEVESLAGEKEGCDDGVECIRTQRAAEAAPAKQVRARA